MSDRSEPLPSEVKSLIIDENALRLPSLTIEWQKVISGGIVVKCKEMTSRNDVDALRRTPLYVQRNWIAVKEVDEYFWADLVGKQIVDCEGALLGTVTRVDNYGASDIISVKAPSGRLTLEIPFVRDYIDMSFVSTDDKIKLHVKRETFDECWQE